MVDSSLGACCNLGLVPPFPAWSPRGGPRLAVGRGYGERPRQAKAAHRGGDEAQGTAGTRGGGAGLGRHHSPQGGVGFTGAPSGGFSLPTFIRNSRTYTWQYLCVNAHVHPQATVDGP